MTLAPSDPPPGGQHARSLASAADDGADPERMATTEAAYQMQLWHSTAGWIPMEQGFAPHTRGRKPLLLSPRPIGCPIGACESRFALLESARRDQARPGDARLRASQMIASSCRLAHPVGAPGSICVEGEFCHSYRRQQCTSSHLRSQTRRLESKVLLLRESAKTGQNHEQVLRSSVVQYT